MDYKKIAKELSGAIKKLAQEKAKFESPLYGTAERTRKFQAAMSMQPGQASQAIAKTVMPSAPQKPKAIKKTEPSPLKGEPMTPERAAVLKKDPKLRAEYLSTIGATPTKY